MNRPAHKTEGVNRTKIVRVYPFVFTGEVPCKEVRTPLTSITFSEERDEETNYGYCNEYQPHAVKRMFDHKNGMLYDMRWDEAGNLGQVSMGKPGEMFERGRFLFWTEDNRMHAAVDEKYYSYYVYDYSGERRLKLTGESSRMDVNANLMTISTSLDNPTLYPSPYLVLTRTEYTKHYYAGTDRVAACLGGGGLDIVLGNNLTEPTAPAYSTPWGGLFDNGSTDPEEVIVNDTIVMLQEASTKLFEQSGWQVNQRELNGNELNCIAEIDAYHAELHRTIAGIPDRMETGITLDFDKFHDKVRDLKKIQHDEREYVYYYHGDHLGSASWITNHNGDAVQHLQYLPYGEPYVDKRTSGYSERFRFTGKERDEETGYGYFGARYMDHELMTMWLSVDPMSDKYPSISPYAYCAWNPIKLVDPDGREIGDFLNENGEKIGSDGKNDGKKYLLKMIQPSKRKTDSEADNTLFGISKEDRKKAEDFIRKNDGNQDEFTENCIAYQNSTLIPTTAEEFVEMRESCKDEGHAVFNMEHGGLKGVDGNIYGGNDGTSPGMAVGTEAKVNIKRSSNLSYKYWFHHHPDDRSVYQMPSPADLNTFPDLTGYTISYRQKRFYVTKGGRCEGYITFKGSMKFKTQ